MMKECILGYTELLESLNNLKEFFSKILCKIFDTYDDVTLFNLQYHWWTREWLHEVSARFI